MAVMSSLLISHVHGTVHTKSRSFQSCQRAQAQAFTSNSASLSWLGSQDLWCVKLWASLREAPQHTRRTHVLVSSSYGALPSSSQDLLRICAVAFTNVVSGLKAHPVLSSCAPPLAMIFFTVYGLVPSLKRIHQALTKKKNWEKSQMQHIVVSYVRPLLLWMGVISICRVVDPVVLSSAASQAIKDRSINFIRSLSTVLAFAVCTTNLTQQVQKSMERPDTEKGRNLGIQFISNAICTSVWVAAVCLFIELLGFSTQKWITAGGLGTVLVTLAGREIFTNFLSSVMIHATRPFSESQWIQTKIEGQEVSGTVEHVGWWSPTVIRGDDREAVHIPNHKFTVSVVRNLSQKTHWRIKTHLAISHLDAGKISLIVADMRKVLAKHPQVEHKRLHRRVFLDYIHPENQALHILISCFVKTSHFEEYLRVKEVILLDLLKVISHHKARLATPIRTVQRVSSDEELHTHTSRVHKPILISDASVLSDTHTHHKEEKGDDTQKNPKLEGLDSMGLNSKDITLLGAAFGKPMVTIQAEVEQEDTEEEVSTEVDGTVRKKVYVQDDVKEQIVGSIRAQADGKGGAKEQTVGSKRAQADSKGKGQENLVSKGKGLSRTPSVEENLVLGVALDRPKRTLPLESVRDGNGDKTEASTQPAADARERER